LELLALLGQWASSPLDQHREAALKLFTELLRGVSVNLSDYIEEFSRFLQLSFRDNSVKVRIAALEAMNTLLNIKPQSRKDFQPYLVNIFEV
jgi:hypothetical protein